MCSNFVLFDLDFIALSPLRSLVSAFILFFCFPLLSFATINPIPLLMVACLNINHSCIHLSYHLFLCLSLSVCLPDCIVFEHMFDTEGERIKGVTEI